MSNRSANVKANGQDSNHVKDLSFICGCRGKKSTDPKREMTVRNETQAQSLFQIRTLSNYQKKFLLYTYHSCRTVADSCITLIDYFADDVLCNRIR